MNPHLQEMMPRYNHLKRMLERVNSYEPKIINRREEFHIVGDISEPSSTKAMIQEVYVPAETLLKVMNLQSVAILKSVLEVMRKRALEEIGSEMAELKEFASVLEKEVG